MMDVMNVRLMVMRLSRRHILEFIPGAKSRLLVEAVLPRILVKLGDVCESMVAWLLNMCCLCLGKKATCLHMFYHA